jgi:hypothetical protein
MCIGISTDKYVCVCAIPAVLALVVELMLPFLVPPPVAVALDALVLPALLLLLLSTRARNNDVPPLGLRVAGTVALVVVSQLSSVVTLVTLLLLPLLLLLLLTLAIGAAVAVDELFDDDVVAFTASSICCSDAQSDTHDRYQKSLSILPERAVTAEYTHANPDHLRPVLSIT